MGTYPIPPLALPCDLGGCLGQAPSYTGLLDDVQIYQGALTAQQVLFLYQHPAEMLPMPWKSVPPINSLLLD